MRSSRFQSSIVDRPSSIVHRRAAAGAVLLLCALSSFSRPPSLANNTGELWRDLAVALAEAGTLSAQQYTFEQIAAGLKHTDAATRVRAIQILRDADYAEAAGPIGETLGDSDDRVQLAAIDAERSLFTLRPVSKKQRIGFIIEKRTTVGAGDAAEGQLALKVRTIPGEVLAGLVLALSDTNPRVRIEAVGLAALLSPVACSNQEAARTEQLCAQIGNVLIENINSREPEVRRAAMHALARLRYTNAVQALLDQFSYHQKGPDATAALAALAGIGHGSASSIFEQAVASSNAGWRRFGVEGLARSGNRDALAALQQTGQSERSSEVLLALHFATIKLGEPGQSLAQIVASSGDSALRPIAVQYLLDLAPLGAAPLAQFLGDQDAEVRRIIADVLGFSGDPKIIPALEAAAKDADPDAAAAAQRAVDRIKLNRASAVSPGG